MKGWGPDYKSLITYLTRLWESLKCLNRKVMQLELGLGNDYSENVTRDLQEPILLL